MRILKVVSALLSYPQAELSDALDEIAAVVEADADLPAQQKAGLLSFINTHKTMGLIEWQQGYVECFDRGRNLSLLIFEHIHGESRDRGQAMVDLLRIYREHGFDLAAKELPDYIPLFLEYLSQRPKVEALDLLHGALPVLNLLGARLAERESAYAVLFDSLAVLAGDTQNPKALREQAATEGPDETLLRMDEIWEEEAVSFLGNPKACQTQAADHTLRYTPRAHVGAGHARD
ncbi:MAG: nitrate reductase molybdenum cofactor assembly chaperone [Candidatus Methylumidiphilus sp.]